MCFYTHDAKRGNSCNPIADAASNNHKNKLVGGLTVNCWMDSLRFSTNKYYTHTEPQRREKEERNEKRKKNAIK